MSKLEIDITDDVQDFVSAMSAMAQRFVNHWNALPPEAWHAIGLKHPREYQEAYYWDQAPADELVDYIISQPNHTWRGMTIYPDEAWRYRHSDRWMEWRR